MEPDHTLARFIDALNESVTQDNFVKLSLGNHYGATPDLKNVFVRKLKLKGLDKLSFTYRYKTKDIVKNYEVTEGLELLKTYLEQDFKISTLFTTTAELQYELLNNGKIVLRNKVLTTTLQVTDSHDKQKKRPIGTEGKPYLHALGITDSDGKVFKHAQDKYRQINHYIDILSPLIKTVPPGSIKQVADMGAGKGYLTFALYDFLKHTMQLDVQVTGVEFRPDLVKLCNEIAKTSGFDGLHFIEGTIEDYPVEQIDLLIALHACDTATDDAIFKGIKANAGLIVVAPCCHKQIRREMEKSKKPNDVSFLTRHGIFLERQAEMATDGLRALMLEYAGYKTKVFEFISDAHTPKNVLVVGIKQKAKSKKEQAEVLEKIRSAKEFFGIGYHHLEKLLGIS